MCVSGPDLRGQCPGPVSGASVRGVSGACVRGQCPGPVSGASVRGVCPGRVSGASVRGQCPGPVSGASVRGVSGASVCVLERYTLERNLDALEALYSELMRQPLAA